MVLLVFSIIPNLRGFSRLSTILKQEVKKGSGDMNDLDYTTNFEKEELEDTLRYRFNTANPSVIDYILSSSYQNEIYANTANTAKATTGDNTNPSNMYYNKECSSNLSPSLSPTIKSKKKQQ